MQNPSVITLSSEAVEQLSPLDLFGTQRFSDLESQLQQRALIEQRWLEDLRQYRGEYEPDFLKALTTAKKSAVFVNITREKTDAWASQMGDMLFPVDDKNYGIAASPDPELTIYAKQRMQTEDGEQPTQDAMVATELMKIAQDAATGMEKTIDDQLIACDYNAESRRMLHYAAKLGTGILNGPIVESSVKQSWSRNGGAWQAEIIKDIKPAARCVLPWDFVPDMSADRFSRCEFVYERKYLTKKELKRLKDLEDHGFIAEQIDKLLMASPSSTRTRHHEFTDQIRYLCGLNPSDQDARYEVWTYHGPIPADVLAFAGVDVGEMSGQQFDGVAIFAGDVVIKVTLNPLETEEWPYSVYVCEPDEGCIFGLSMPYLMRNPQKIINSAWRAMLDNASKAVGPQVVVNKRLITPADGSWEVTPFKVWEMDSNMQFAEAQKAFGVFHFESRQQEMSNIMQLAMNLLDRESGVPMISQGEQGQVTPTLGGMSMLMNAANAVRRQQVKEYDDNITKPMIRRFYAWNMQFNEDDSIKGDFEVQARGTSALLVKEIQTAQLTNILDKYTQNPTFAPMFEPYEAMKTLFQSMHIDNAKVLRSKEEYEAAIEKQSQGGQQDPIMMKLQLEGQLAQQKMQHEQTMLQYKAQQAAQTAQINASMEMQKLQATNELKLMMLQLQHEDSQRRERIELMKLAQNKQMSQDRLLIELEKLDKQQAHDSQKFMAEIKMKQLLPPNGNFGLE